MTRTVLVTGGSSGIGRAVAARFGEAGDEVIVVARDAERLAASAAGIGARPVACDLTEPEQVALLAAELDGPVDALVNAAGGNVDLGRPPGDPDDLGQLLAAWRANLDANLISAVLVTTALRDRLRPGGTVVNVGSIGAEYAGSSYGAAKAALAAWTAGLSAELGPRGITANTISPGYTTGTGFFRGRLTEQRRTALVAATHTGRAGEPEDVAATAHFLASPGARHLTGQVLHLNGGAHTTR